ncbi:protein Flattop-like isoform X2 [Ictalurus furcatus]|uniref:protein Flattop-like isoform X2 n=1 Tax=Ictalurus furcatus TaxID=66913 RepID=UPI002350835A|nr:protein Flattop-like isoform X2 [Ictalurus furcatus]
MSSSFSANQYDSAFKSNKLQNWTVPKQYKEKPSPAEGHTIFIATDRGHLLPGVKGTWDLPSHIPPVHINPTARSQEGQQRLRGWGQVQHLVPSASGKLNETNENSRTPQCEGTSGNGQHKGFSVNIPAPDGPGLERTVSQASQVQSRPATQQSQVQSRPATQQSQVQSIPATQQSQVQSIPATQQSQVQSRPATQQSQVQSRPATQQSQVQSRPATQQSQVQSIPATQQSQVQSRPATQQSQVQSIPATQQSQVQSRPATQQSHAEPQPASTQSQAKSRPLTQASQTSNQD